MKFHKSMRIHQKELENSEKLYFKKKIVKAIITILKHKK